LCPVCVCGAICNATRRRDHREGIKRRISPRRGVKHFDVIRLSESQVNDAGRMNVTPRYAAASVISRIGVNMPNFPIVQQATMDRGTVCPVSKDPSEQRSRQVTDANSRIMAVRIVAARLFVALISQGGFLCYQATERSLVGRTTYR
jgi:hypothetical protein